MKELRIYEVRTDNKSYLLRSVRLHSSFLGITPGGGVIHSEFKSLAQFLEPKLDRMRIDILDL